MKGNLLPQVRLFLLQCVLTALIALPISNANAQRHGGYGSQAPITSQVNSYLKQGDQINVNRSLRLNRVLQQGKDIVSLSVKAQATQYGSKLVLKLNGQRLQVQQIGSYLSNTQFQVPRLMMQDKLVLVVKGGAFIQGLSAQVQSHGPGPGAGGQVQPIKAQIHQQLYMPTTLQVRKLLKEYTGAQLKGMKIKKVIMKASSLRGRAQATLLINGQPVGYSQTLPQQPTKLVFQLPAYGANIVGRDIKSIQIQLQGRNMTVKMVGVKAVQQGGHHGGMNSVQIQVNQRIQGGQRLILAQLMGHGQQINMNKQIEAITIVARGHGTIMLAGAGSGQGGIQVQGQTTQSLPIFGYGATAKSIKLRVSGNILIQSLRIKFKSVYY